MILVFSNISFWILFLGIFAKNGFLEIGFLTGGFSAVAESTEGMERILSEYDKIEDSDTVGRIECISELMKNAGDFDRVFDFETVEALRHRARELRAVASEQERKRQRAWQDVRAVERDILTIYILSRAKMLE